MANAIKTKLAEWFSHTPEEERDRMAKLLGLSIGQVLAWRIYKRLGAPRWAAWAIPAVIGELQLLRYEVERLRKAQAVPTKDDAMAKTVRDLFKSKATASPEHEGMRTFTERRLAADVVVFHKATSSILLVKRKWPPFKGSWALPGGVVETGEGHRVAAVRELAEETGLKVTPDAMIYLCRRGKPGRDPRGPMISHVYLTVLEGPAYDGDPPTVRAADDAAEVRWMPTSVTDSAPLAFDHREIINMALGWL